MHAQLGSSTLGALLDRAARAFGTRRAIDFPIEQLPGSGLSFEALAATARGRARQLQSLGFGKGDRVGLLLPNGPEFIVFWLGAALIGAITVPFNTRYRARELAYVIGQSRIRLLVSQSTDATQPDLPARLLEALPGALHPGREERLDLADAPLLERVVVLPAREQRPHDGSDAPPAVLVEPHDIALMMYTSGTTANPKGCLLTHATLLTAAGAMAFERYRLEPRDRLWNPLPMFHLSSLHPFIGCLASGATFLSMTHFDPAIAARQISRESPTVLYPAFPTIVNELLAMPAFDPSALDQLRRINCVGPPDALRRIQARFPQAQVTSVYGLTEAGGVVAYGDPDEPLATRVTSCGRPFRGIEVRIAPLESNRIAADIGEIQLRGWCVFAGYFAQPEATQAALAPDGWLRTGDLGSVDADGRIHYLGRVKDILKVGGENVSAVEVESVLMRHPGVKLAQVVGIEDARYGEVPVAFIELENAAEPDIEGLSQLCTRELASFKRPRQYHFVTEWPMSATKIQKGRLRELIASTPA
jgi:fatty-acyl-CoA synthase